MQEGLFVIDMLNDFVYGSLKCERAQPIIPNIEKLLKKARRYSVSVFYLNDAHQKSDFENKRWGIHALKGTEGARIITELKPTKRDYLIEKRTYSGFFETGLDSILRSLKIDKVYLTGLHTNVCARHTAADAFFRGYEIAGIEDALQAFTEKDHRDGLEYLKFAYGAEIIKTDDVIEKWKAEKEGSKN